jgi:hypothetical protein
MMEPRLQEMQAEIEWLKIKIASTPSASQIHTTAAMNDVMLVTGIRLDGR